MKKPFSITDLALNVIRVCLVLGILVALIDFYKKSQDTPDLVITGLSTGTAAELPEEDGKPAVTTSEPAPAAETTATSAETAAPAATAVPAETEPVESTVVQTTTAETSAVQPEAHSVVKEFGSADPNEFGAPVNINTASESLLMTLKGIGEVKAAAIVEYRQKNGEFGSIDDLMKVSGIGEKTFEKIRNQITV